MSKKWGKGKNGTLVTIASIASIENVRLCPHHTQMIYGHIVKGLQKNNFKKKGLKIYGVSKKFGKRQKWDLGNYCYHRIHKECLFVSPSHQNALQTYCQGVTKQ